MKLLLRFFSEHPLRNFQQSRKDLSKLSTRSSKKTSEKQKLRASSHHARNFRQDASVSGFKPLNKY